MYKTSLNLGKLSCHEKVQLCRTVVSKMASNTLFPNPSPPLTYLSTLANELTAEEQALKDAQKTVSDLIISLRNKEKEMDVALRAEANYVDNVAQGDQAIVSSSGMYSIDSSAKVGVGMPNRPDGLKASEGNKDGTINLRWKGANNATIFIVQLSEDISDAKSWVQIALSTKRSFVASNLHSGKRYWFRVAGTNSAGTGGFSDPATKIAP